MSDEKLNQNSSNPRDETLIATYKEICQTYRAIDDFRAKLLALLPIASGAGGILLLTKKDLSEDFLRPIGLFGMLVTLGLFFYEVRGILICRQLQIVGKNLEHDLKLNGDRGFFKSNPEKKGCFRIKVRKKVLYVPWAVAAAVIIYITVFMGWGYIACVAKTPLS